MQFYVEFYRILSALIFFLNFKLLLKYQLIGYKTLSLQTVPSDVSSKLWLCTEAYSFFSCVMGVQHCYTRKLSKSCVGHEILNHPSWSSYIGTVKLDIFHGFLQLTTMTVLHHHYFFCRFRAISRYPNIPPCQTEQPSLSLSPNIMSQQWETLMKSIATCPWPRQAFKFICCSLTWREMGFVRYACPKSVRHEWIFLQLST